MKSGITLFRIFGIDVKLHFSWWFIFILLAWSLASAYFPAVLPEQTVSTYWSMGIIAALLLFTSVLLHELSHSLVARVQHIKVQSITLFFFGGVAGLERDDLQPRAEFLMAIAGPLFSLVLAGFFFLIHQINGNVIVAAITAYLYRLNFILALFNLVPGFPLDGGRAFRAILYAYYKDLKKATKIASTGGKFFAAVLIILGILGMFTGQGSGLWFILLGGFLFFLANLSYEQVVIKGLLSSLPVKQLMLTKISIVSPEIPLKEFLRKYAEQEQDVFWVQDKKFSGLLDMNKVDPLPQQMQEVVRLKQLAIPLQQLKTLNKVDNAYTAFQKLNEQDVALLPVMEKARVVGFVTRKAVMHHLMWDLKYAFDDHSMAKKVLYHLKRHKK